MAVENLVVETLTISLRFIKIKLLVKIVKVLNNILFKVYNCTIIWNKIYMIIKVVQYGSQMNKKKELIINFSISSFKTIVTNLNKRFSYERKKHL